MKAYSIFLIALMGVNFALMAYGRAAKVIFVGFGVMAYSICVFWSPVNLDWYPLLERSLFFFLALLGFVFALYRQHNSRYFTPSFFVFSWVTSVRMLGFPENPNFGEKGGALLLIGGFNAVLLFWIILLVFHRKTYQKILFGLLSACLLVFFCSLSRAELSEGVVFFVFAPFHVLNLLLSFVSLPLSYAFFYCGELLLFLLLCYEVFFRDPKGSHAEWPQDQGCQAPSQESNTPSHSSQSHPPRES